MKNIRILAIESSCDETSIAIVENGKRVLALSTNTQIAIHANYGGVVPEIASRMHTENITLVLEDVLKQTNVTLKEVDAIAVTYGPGLMGSLLVGVEFAKTLSFIYNKPLIAVNHLIGHIYANNIESNLKFPLLSLIVSGGHTEMLIMEDDYKFNLLGRTLDDAIGESYDKVAKVLGIPYPGGPNIEKMSELGSVTYNLPTPVLDDTYNFSYSGIKSAVINIVNNEKQRGNKIRENDLACSFQFKAVDEICRKVDIALKNNKVNQLVVAGGVSANKYLKKELEKICNKHNVDLKIPQMKYCTDNAAMIGAAAYPLFLKNEFADFNLNAESGLTIV
ncbi:MAG: tRNA (adenosine(37)-N6)-threonylcarbamoyltransferase complex transferase subunit TsaD [Bacilli bacterium]|nr:tRNA (adenosine(37)-N6)-threonylcarbamoyltransferase complex transferase subunit TsaD [Bacilli bacterium]